MPLSIFRKKPATPFFDSVVNASPERISAYIESHEKTAMTLAAAIGLLILDGTKHLVKPDKNTKRLGGVDIAPDVFAFEAAIFFGYALRQAFNPIDLDTHDPMNRVWNDAYSIVCSLADKSCGWDTSAIAKSRILKYIRVGGIGPASEYLVELLRDAQGSNTPLLAYPSSPSLDFRQTAIISMLVGPFVKTFPEAYAETLRRLIEGYDFEF